jgi:4-amino-4-deoxy-L-arabinose transferase-like glycosyltransferase
LRSEIDILKRTYAENKILIWFLSGLTVLRLIYIALIPLVPQEAYYWYYSLKPDLSYFDHPPMVAYSIWLGTHLFGDTVFGVKFMAVIWSALTNIFLYLTVNDALFNTEEKIRKQVALATVFFYNLTIFGHLYAVTMVQDTPLLFFWLLVIFFVQRYIRNNNPMEIYLAGFALGFGLISKYTAIAIVPGIFLTLLLDRSLRRNLLKKDPYIALIFAFLVFTPVLIWNFNHDWGSLKFQFADRSEELKPIQTKYIFQLIASQLFLLTPLALIYFFKTTRSIIQHWRENTIKRFYFLSGIFIVGGFTLLSLKTLIKMNWLLPGYLGFVLATSIQYYREDILKSGWFKAGVVISLCLIIFAYSILLIPNIPLGDGNTWSGWKESAERVAKIQEENGGVEKTFIFANSYKTASLIKFYLPGEQDIYAQNIYGQPALQFDIWGLPKNLKGKDAIFVFTDRGEYKSDLDKVSLYFDKLTLISENKFMFNATTQTRVIYCYYAKNYRGTGPD